MENVYDQKRRQNLNFILPSQYLLQNKNETLKENRIVVVIHLHYLDTVENYFKYIKFIPDDMDILFTVSSSKVSRVIEENILHGRGNCRIIKKQNRGRDISAFLVACREEILKYEFVCFLHDKKEKTKVQKSMTEKWIRCLWENMAGSREYIENLRMLFANNPQLGLLVPPSFISEDFAAAYRNAWYKNFPLASELAKQMNLDCDLDASKTPITLGTVFWARVDALRKLLETGWKYEDFDEEPLKGDGTISHAIERILAYVAQDAGFDTGWVMTDRYAGERMEYMLEALEKTFGTLHSEFGVYDISSLDSFKKRKDELLEFVGRYNCFYIYGAGTYGKRCLAMLKSGFKIPEAFLVSDAGSNPKEIEGIPVCSFENTELNGQCGIIMAVSSMYEAEVRHMIYSRDIDFANVYLYTNK